MTETRSSVRSLNCPSCGGTIALRAAGSTVSLVCEHCGSTLDATKPDLRIIVEADEAMHRPEIPLGTRGTLGDTTWEVIGYQDRTDDEVVWCEYLLFNPYEGYAFLIDDGRRFSLGKLLTTLPGDRWNGLTLSGENFDRFGTTYPVRTTFVVGEFYWRVAVGEQVSETDYVRPGTMLACEEDGNERTWTASQLQDWGVAERAFGIQPRPRSTPGTPAPHEPSPYRTQLRDAKMVALLALAACLVIAIGTGGSSRILKRDLTARLDGTTQTTVLGPIVIPGAREKVRIQGRAGNLDNMWVDLDYSLVDRATQQSYDAAGTAEYYHGRDSDGAWSEGSAEPTTGFASIPQGTYDLVVETAAHRWTDPKASSVFTVTGIFGTGQSADDSNRTVPVSVAVDRGGGFVGPFFLALLAIALWPLIVWGKHRSFEQRRLAPVAGGSDDDDEEDDE